MLDKSRLFEVAATLTPADFWLDSHRRIFAAMLTLGERDSAIDIITLSNELGSRREIETVGGVAFLAILTEGIPRRPEIDNYLAIVKDKAIQRSLVGFSEALSARAYDQSEPGLAVASWAISELSTIADSGQVKGDVHGAASLAEDAEYRLIDHPEKTPSISTGIADLDEKTGGGIRLGELWIIGASPSRGKTTLARQIVKTAVSTGFGSHVHSGEMTKESWTDITACLLEDMPTFKLREPHLLNDTERERLRNGLRSLAKLPLTISDEGGAHIDRLIWNATRQKRKANIQLLAVDYAQIIGAPGRDPRERVTAVANRLRLFAKDENVAVLLLSQSPRPEGRSLNARPTMYSLKESGALEEAAHTVILPYRPVNQETGVFTGEDELIIAKQRAGAIGSVPVYLNGKYLKFEGRSQ
jgi:replicative DNA helicase